MLLLRVEFSLVLRTTSCLSDSELMYSTYQKKGKDPSITP